MDREKQKVNDIFRKISSKELIGAELQENKLMYSIVGFVPISDSCDNALIISNLGYLLAEKGLNTCVVDFKVFYPNLFQFLDAKPNNKGKGLIRVLRSDKVDFREEIIATKYDKLFLLSPSPQDLMEEYFDFDFQNIERVITTLRDMFDIVLIDIPNNPPLEFCLAAMKYCHIGFFTATERMDASSNMVKLLDYASSVGISTAKFTRVILMNLLDLRFDYKIISDIGFTIVAALPLVKDAIAKSLEGKLYVKDTPIINKYFIRELRGLADILANQ